MTPWAGEGVNLAMWDAWDLAQVLVGGVASSSSSADDTRRRRQEEEKKRQGTGEEEEINDARTWQVAIDKGIKGYEEKMMERAKGKAEETRRNQAMMLGGDGAAERMAEFFKGAFAE